MVEGRCKSDTARFLLDYCVGFDFGFPFVQGNAQLENRVIVSCLQPSVSLTASLMLSSIALTENQSVFHSLIPPCCQIIPQTTE